MTRTPAVSRSQRLDGGEEARSLPWWRRSALLLFLLLGLVRALGAPPATLSAPGAAFYAAPTGSPTGAGTPASPWDLRTALSRSQSQVPPGSVVYMRGGTYRGVFTSRLEGAPDAPIVVRAHPGERVVIDGHETASLVEALPVAERGAVHTCRIDLPRPLDAGSLIVIEGEELYLASALPPNGYRCLRGWNGSPVLAHAVGAVVVVGASAILSVDKPNVWFWGLEVTSSFVERRLGSSGGQTAVSSKPGGYNLRAPGVKIINNLIHDVGHPAIAFFSAAEGCDVPNDASGRNPCAEIYGTLIWGNGYYDLTRGGQPIGSAVYTQNRYGTKYLRDNVMFRNFTTGINIYTEGGYVNDFHVEGNTSFDNGLYDLWATGGTVEPMRNLRVLHNYTFRRPSDPVTSAAFGYQAAQGDMTFAHNYIVSGAESAAFVANNFTTRLEVTDNTFVATGASGRLALLRAPSTPPPGSYFWDRNDYYDGGNTVYAFAFNGATNGLGGGYLAFDDPGTALGKGWRQWTGFDASSAYRASLPLDRPGTGFREDLRVFVRPNLYEPGRGHVTVYNWTAQGAEVAVDLSSVLAPGALYEVRDAQNYGGGPLRRATFDWGMVVLPLNLTAVRPLAGSVTHLSSAHTAPRFAVFVVETVSPAVAPQITSFSASPTTVTAGQAVTFSWSLAGGAPTALSIDNGVGSVLGLASKAVTLNTAGTFAYRLTATNAAGSLTSAPVTVTVNPAVSAPQITTFSASPTTVTAGQAVTFSWSLAGGAPTALSIDNGVGSVLGLASKTVTLNTAGAFAYRLTVTNSAGSVTSAPVTVTVNAPNPSSFPLYLEAETASLVPPLASAPDSLASGGRYVSSPTRDQGTATFSVTLPQTGRYYLWGRVLSPDSARDSFYVAVDGAAEDIWDTAEQLWSPSWQWTRVTGRAGNGGTPSPRNESPRVFNLPAGPHSFTFRGRDPETRFDRLLLTNSATQTP